MKSEACKTYENSQPTANRIRPERAEHTETTLSMYLCSLSFAHSFYIVFIFSLNAFIE